MRRLACLIGAVAASWWCGSSAVASAADPASGDEILSEIISRGHVFEQMYVGSYSRRTASVRVRDGDNKELKTSRDIVIDVWDYHGEAPINDVQSCVINEETVALSECVEEQRLEPAHRLFGAESEKHYRFEYRGLATWNGRSSHKIGVIPLQASTRHLKGDLFYLEGSLHMTGMEISLADYPFGLKDLSIQLFFKERDGKPVIDRGVTNVHVYVPFLIHEQTRTEFLASGQRLLEERDPASSAAVSKRAASR